METIESKVKNCKSVQELDIISQKYCKEIFYNPELEFLIQNKIKELSESVQERKII